MTTVLQKCPEFTHFNLIATWKLSWVVLFTVNSTVTQWTHQWPSAMHYSSASRHNFASFRSCNFYRDKLWQNNKRVYKDFFCKRCKRLSHLWFIVGVWWFCAGDEVNLRVLSAQCGSTWQACVITSIVHASISIARNLSLEALSMSFLLTPLSAFFPFLPFPFPPPPNPPIEDLG